MISLVQIVSVAYFVAINIYGIIILKAQMDYKKCIHENNDENTCEQNPKEKVKKVSDFRLILTGILGGALGILVFMFIYKYRLRSMLLVVLLPVLVALDGYLIFMLFAGGIFNITII